MPPPLIDEADFDLDVGMASVGAAVPPFCLLDYTLDGLQVHWHRQNKAASV